MGVPALFRWLSKKYPKIIYPVVEDEEPEVADNEGKDVTIPIDITRENPNGVEFDNLYLDMNAIVHPCTHPEGKPAPETEEEMMVEVFKYTERVVNMIRPRRVLFLAVDGVAPRAKMNQQRSRRFRSAQEAKEKEEARKEAVAMWEAMGKTLSEEEKTREAWDSNAITPGTPFMELLAISLRYWIVRKINTDPGWMNLQVIFSDASVPGEGEHKIMDFIRRLRTNPGHDPNTHHVIYGLDADLIMLSLATHEPHFRVLREDVFFQSGSATACRICGREGHFAAQCTGVKAEVKKIVPPEKKPFIFLDVAVLREYLEVELNVPRAPFAFNLEQAIDDWVLLCFFVGNDFLPHLPSLEIREGAIDTLLRIWKQEIPKMGGYLTNHGQLVLERAQIILEGLAQREDDIFRRRREGEERQNHQAKRRKLEADISNTTGPSPMLQLTAVTTAPPIPPVHPSLPPRPMYDFAVTADSIGFGAPQTRESVQHTPTAVQAIAGSNHDVVANRRAIRMANMSAAEMLKAELSGVKPNSPKAQPELDLSLPPKPSAIVTKHSLPSIPAAASIQAVPMSNDLTLGEVDMDIPGQHTAESPSASEVFDFIDPNADADADADAEGDSDLDSPGADMTRGAVDDLLENIEMDTGATEPDGEEPTLPLTGIKRKFNDRDLDDLGSDEEGAIATVSALAMKVNPDGTVEQEDKVKLWEPGYRQRYYRQKFDVDEVDEEFKKKLTQCYIEGLAWVLQYYYQGTPSWHWYYPYHFAPFAADFKDIHKLNIKFDLSQPFKPFEQLMAVFPAASRKHIPAVFQPLMIDEDSPIIDFYPQTFEIDMNGKRMAWQGVALLPFIDEKRLLDAMAPEYPKLNDEEVRRNRWGNTVTYVSDKHRLYPFFESLYGKKKHQEPISITVTQSLGISGSVLPDPSCLPGSTYETPFPTQNLPDIPNDRSLSVAYFFPKQLSPHRSVLLPGVKRPCHVLNAGDLERLRGSGRHRRAEGDDNAPIRGSDYQNGYTNKYTSRTPYANPNSYDNSASRGYSGQSYRGNNSYNSSYSPPRQPYPSQGYGGYRGGYTPNYGGYGAPARGGSSRGGSPQNSGGYGGRGGYEGYSGQHGYNGYDGYGVYGGQAAGQAHGYGPARRRGRGW